MSTSRFDLVTDTSFLGKTERGSYIFTGVASGEWSIGNVPHVSYVMAIMTDGVIKHFATKYQTDPVALNCFFFNKTLPGGLILEIDELKMSRKGYCVVRCILKQRKDLKALTDISTYNPSEWSDKVLSIFTMGNMDNEQGPTYFYKNPLPPSEEHMQPYHYMFMGDFLDCTFDMRSIPSTLKDAGRPEVNQTMAFSDGRPIDFKSIPYWCDMFIAPPSMLGPAVLGEPVWCATMQLEVQFKRKPTGHKILGHCMAPHIINGRFDNSGEIYNQDGEILALTRHQCLVLPWSRNSSDSKAAQDRINSILEQKNSKL